MKDKIILFGGSFNPVHLGHVSVAEFSLAELQANRLIFIPAKRSPFKSQSPQVSDQNRLDMLNLAIDGHENFTIDDCELYRPAPSFTIDTINHLRQKYGLDVEFSWLIGSDMVKDLAKWHKIDELMDKCNLCIMNRGGYDEVAFDDFQAEMGQQYTDKLKNNAINTPLYDVSSTDIRARVKQGQDIKQMVGVAVAEYIKRNKLYTS